jgi:putative transposase
VGALPKAVRHEWVHFFNSERPHDYLDDLTPVAAEELHYAHGHYLAEAG